MSRGPRGARLGAGRALAWTLLFASLALTLTPRFDRQETGWVRGWSGQQAGAASLGDAERYTAYVAFFRGRERLDAVSAPFFYRPVAPLLASRLPVASPMTALNVVNAASLAGTLVLLLAWLGRLGFGFREAWLGGLLFSVSFPVFYYGSDGGVDPPLIFLVALGLWAMARGPWSLLLPILALGALTKETVVVLLPVFAALRFARGEAWLGPSLALGLAWAAPMAAIRLALEAPAGGLWWPSPETLLSNLRPRALASVALSVGLPGLLAAGLWLSAARRPQLPAGWTAALAVGLATSAALVAYAFAAAYADGRFAWPSALFSIPLALAGLRAHGWLGPDGSRRA